MPMTVTERSISMADPMFMAQDTAKSTRKYRRPDKCFEQVLALRHPAMELNFVRC